VESSASTGRFFYGENPGSPIPFAVSTSSRIIVPSRSEAGSSDLRLAHSEGKRLEAGVCSSGNLCYHLITPIDAKFLLAKGYAEPVSNAKRRTLITCSYVLCALVVLYGLWIGVRWIWSPPLRINRTESKIAIDTSFFGEYPTTVSRIRMSDVHNRTVLWEIQAATPDTQIRGFSLNEGANPVLIKPTYGSYRLVVPSNSATFTLSNSSVYELELWAGNSDITKASATVWFGETP
jgi:hypothetical protein